MREIIFTYAADADIQRAYNFYEDLNEGLGTRFLESIERALEQVAAFPESGPLFRGRHRRVFLKRFPYGLFYAVYSRRIVVSGVVHLFTDIKDFTKRLEG